MSVSAALINAAMMLQWTAWESEIALEIRGEVCGWKGEL